MKFELLHGSVDKAFTLPNVCPYCHHRSTLIALTGYAPGENYYVIVRCPNDLCREVFVVVYKPFAGNLKLSHTVGGNIEYKKYSDTIQTISPNFQEIHRQAETAEFHKLDQIAGVGYRKALEFLIKDYAKKLSPANASDIETIMLSPVIEKYITSQRIKDIAKRAAWIGNDETHYVRKWIDADINSLKSLITLVVNFIESEELYNATMAAMPDGKK